MCSATKDEGRGRVWSRSPLPRPSTERGPASIVSNTSQYSGSDGGSQPPEGGKFLPCYFAFLAGCPRVRRKAWSDTFLAARKGSVRLTALATREPGLVAPLVAGSMGGCHNEVEYLLGVGHRGGVAGGNLTGRGPHPILLAMNRSASGLIARSCLETRYQEGTRFQRGNPDGTLKHPGAMGFG
jgi:hypothetical protein